MADKLVQLNLGCGNYKLDGFINVDHSAHCNPDKIVDLETFPWPFESDSASKIVLSHVLEHIGRDVKVFEQVIRELYRVSAPDGLIEIAVPDPNHDNFWGDPTHCRPITPQLLNLFSRAFLAQYKQTAITPIAVMWEVDFAVTKVNSNVDQGFHAWAKQHNIPVDMNNLRYYRNAFLDHHIILQTKKPFRPM